MPDLNIKSNSAFSDGIDFRELIYILWENKHSIALCVLVVLSIALIYNWQKPAIYDATTIIQVEGTKNSVGNLTSQLPFGQTDNDQAALQIALIRSPYILDPVIKSLKLGISIEPNHWPLIGRFFADHDEYLSVDSFTVQHKFFNKKFKVKINDDIHFSLLNENDELILTGEIGKLATSSDKQISIHVSGFNAKPNTEFIAIQKSSNEIIKNIIKQLKIEELGDNIKTGVLAISYSDENPEFAATLLNTIAKTAQEKNLSKKNLESQATLDFLLKQIPQARDALAQAETVWNNYRAKTGKIDMRAETVQVLNLLREHEKRLVQTRLYRAELLQRFTTEHPFIQATEDRIKILQKQIGDLEEQKKLLPIEDQVAVNLIREVKVRNTTYLLLLNKRQEVEVMKAATLSDLSILTPALIPDQPLPKYTVIIATVGALLGFIIGCLIIFIRKAFYRKVTDPIWLEQSLKLPNLAIIPYSKQQEKTIADIKSGRGESTLILSQRHSQDLSIEALRSLRTNLQILSLNAANNIISIMGVSPGIGKSFISVNFASLLADTNKRVLLIDGDIRKGLLHRYFNVSKSDGLTEYLAEQIDLSSAIKQTAIANLFYMSCGNYPNNPTELLMKPRLVEFLQQASKSYDYIVIDTAPILAVSDCILLGRQSGLNFVVVGSDCHQPEEIQLAIQKLVRSQIAIAGTIFNVIKPSGSIKGNYRYNYSYLDSEMASESD